jgi:heme-degrading monooxygenase HmoA
MPALTWTTITEPLPDGTYVGFATKLPLTAHRFVPGFLYDTMRIRRQLRDLPGLVGYSMLAELGPRTFWTVSVWEDEAALHRFPGAEPHRSITRRAPKRMGRSMFEQFDVVGRELPLTWPASKDRFPSSGEG